MPRADPIVAVIFGVAVRDDDVRAAVVDLVDLGEEICNRNGKYRRFRAEGEYLVYLKIEIEKL
jgi:hypothetical protein